MPGESSPRQFWRIRMIHAARSDAVKGREPSCCRCRRWRGTSSPRLPRGFAAHNAASRRSDHCRRSRMKSGHALSKSLPRAMKEASCQLRHRGDGSAQFRDSPAAGSRADQERAGCLSRSVFVRSDSSITFSASRSAERVTKVVRSVCLERSRPGKQSLLLRPNPQAHASVVFHYCSRHCVPPLVQLQLVHPSAAVRQAVYALKEHRGAWGR